MRTSLVAKILVVDDSPSMRSMVKFTLTSAGHDIEEAENGQLGILKAKSSQFDLVMSDVNMPGINGYEFTSQLRELPHYKYTPVLLLTTEHSTEQKTKGRMAGATGWIVKPFQPDALIKNINKILG